jgi:anti-sigma factor RsiW
VLTKHEGEVMDDRMDRLLQYLDGELSTQEAAAVEQALSTDQTYQAELTALKQVDHLLCNTHLVAPAPDFLTRFEVRLGQRIKRRRNIVGVVVIGLVVLLSAGLLALTLADSSSALLTLFNGASVTTYVLNVLQTATTMAGVVIRLIVLLGNTVLQLVQHPLFWGYLFVVAGLVSLWAQLLRWVGFSRPSAV